MGLSQERRFVNYHRVLSRARWSGRAASRCLLGLLVQQFVPEGPIILGVDDTIERRRGQHIPAQGIYRAPVRRSHSPFVKALSLPTFCRGILAWTCDSEFVF
jgi:DDE superfamily endonuclease